MAGTRKKENVELEEKPSTTELIDPGDLCQPVSF